MAGKVRKTIGWVPADNPTVNSVPSPGLPSPLLHSELELGLRKRGYASYADYNEYMRERMCQGHLSNRMALNRIWRNKVGQALTLFESGTINHSDTSPRLKFYCKTPLSGKFGDIFGKTSSGAPCKLSSNRRATVAKTLLNNFGMNPLLQQD